MFINRAFSNLPFQGQGGGSAFVRTYRGGWLRGFLATSVVGAGNTDLTAPSASLPPIPLEGGVIIGKHGPLEIYAWTFEFTDPASAQQWFDSLKYSARGGVAIDQTGEHQTGGAPFHVSVDGAQSSMGYTFHLGPADANHETSQQVTFRQGSVVVQASVAGADVTPDDAKRIGGIEQDQLRATCGVVGGVIATSPA